jgi:hypothetical protein
VLISYFSRQNLPAIGADYQDAELLSLSDAANIILGAPPAEIEIIPPRQDFNYCKRTQAVLLCEGKLLHEIQAILVLCIKRLLVGN